MKRAVLLPSWYGTVFLEMFVSYVCEPLGRLTYVCFRWVCFITGNLPDIWASKTENCRRTGQGHGLWLSDWPPTPTVSTDPFTIFLVNCKVCVKAGWLLPRAVTHVCVQCMYYSVRIRAHIRSRRSHPSQTSAFNDSCNVHYVRCSPTPSVYFFPSAYCSILKCGYCQYKKKLN